MRDITTQLRVEQLKAMNTCILTSNDEELIEEWLVYGVPDEPTEEDFYDIAENGEAYAECIKIFKRTIQNEDFYY
ncbi:MAG: hypothetical protein J6J36_06840 [Clostridia bacterium]|nr:hypothetical protein [Clostridia bacterium]